MMRACRWGRTVLGVTFLAVLGSSGTCVTARGQETDRPPNLVFLLVDDLRFNTLGCMGDPLVQTPHIDRLASQGVLFSNAFVTTSICAVSRASYFSGQWMRRHGISNFSDGLNSAAWDETYPAQLRKAGYRTCFIGKYGVGDEREVDRKAQEFDVWHGLPGQAGAFLDPEGTSHVHKTARFGEQALDFIRSNPPDQPFCLSLSFNAVHARDNQPREYAPDFRDEHLYRDLHIPLPELATEADFLRLPPFVQDSEGRRRWGWRFDDPDKAQAILRDYYRLISGVDREVGRIRACLDETGQADRTVIVFTSDNGYALADRGMADKWYAYEEDLRIPLIVFDPRLPEMGRGRVVDAMALNVDIAPTLLDLAGAAIPERMQGRSLRTLVAGDMPADWRTSFFYEFAGVGGARIPAVEAIRETRWKYIRWVESEPTAEELYDLDSDPLERINLVTSPAHQERLQGMREQWKRSRDELH